MYRTLHAQYLRTSVHVSVYVSLHVSVSLSRSFPVCSYACVCVCLSVFTCVFVCLGVCPCVCVRSLIQLLHPCRPHRFIYMVQRDGDDEEWLPSLCARLLTLFYDDPAQVEEYTQQLGILLLSSGRPCTPLEVAVLHMATRSLHFALLMYWELFSSVEDLARASLVHGAASSPLSVSSDKGRAGWLLLCLYGVVEQRAAQSKGRSKQDTPDHYLERMIEKHRAEGPALASIASALCNVQSSQRQLVMAPATPTWSALQPLGAESASTGAANSRRNSSCNGNESSVQAAALQPSTRNSMETEQTDKENIAGVMVQGSAAAMQAGAQGLLEWMSKQNASRAFNCYFAGECVFAQMLVQIAESLRTEAVHLRPARLVVMLTRINSYLATHAVYVPFGNSLNDTRRVVRIPPEHAKIFTTACRTPCWLVLETGM